MDSQGGQNQAEENVLTSRILSAIGSLCDRTVSIIVNINDNKTKYFKNFIIL